MTDAPKLDLERRWKLISGVTEDNTAAYARLREVVVATQQFSAWGVGIATPGMLGLLANAKELAGMSRLGGEVYSVLFVGAELLFVLAILLAIVHQRYCSRELKLVAANSSNVVQQTGIWRVVYGEGREELSAEEQAMRACLEARKAELGQELEAVSEAARPFLRFEYWTLLAAYLVLAAILASSWPGLS